MMPDEKSVPTPKLMDDYKGVFDVDQTPVTWVGKKSEFSGIKVEKKMDLDNLGISFCVKESLKKRIQTVAFENLVLAK
jgi:hypothetical protein